MWYQPGSTAHHYKRENNEWDVYLVSEVNLVAEECIALKHDIPARQTYMNDREAMSMAIMRVSGPMEPCWDAAHVNHDSDIARRRRSRLV